MSQFPTDKQLAALGFLAINEAGYSSIELAKLLKMDKSNFSRIVLKPLSGIGWIKVEKSPKTGHSGRPKEILKITKDIGGFRKTYLSKVLYTINTIIYVA
jgi:hypothetical protein